MAQVKYELIYKEVIYHTHRFNLVKCLIVFSLPQRILYPFEMTLTVNR